MTTGLKCENVQRRWPAMTRCALGRLRCVGGARRALEAVCRGGRAPGAHCCTFLLLFLFFRPKVLSSAA